MPYTSRLQPTIAFPEGKDEKSRIKGIGLASSLGANTSTSFGISIATRSSALPENNVTRIIVGHPVRAELEGTDIRFSPVVRASGAIDLIIISDIKPEDKGGREREETSKTGFKRKPFWYSLWLVLLICIYVHSYGRSSRPPTS